MELIAAATAEIEGRFVSVDEAEDEDEEEEEGETSMSKSEPSEIDRLRGSSEKETAFYEVKDA